VDSRRSPTLELDVIKDELWWTFSAQSCFDDSLDSDDYGHLPPVESDDNQSVLRLSEKTGLAGLMTGSTAQKAHKRCCLIRSQEYLKSLLGWVKYWIQTCDLDGPIQNFLQR
jgi:hypothetical protein